MKIILLFISTLISVSACAQLQLDTITITGGKSSVLRIVEEDDDFVYFIRNHFRQKVAKKSIEKIGYGKKYSLNKDKANRSLKLYEIIELENLSKKEIYHLSKEFVAYEFVSSQDVIQIDDPEIGKIVGKGSFEITNLWNVLTEERKYINFNFRISAKDKKCRLIIERIIIKTRLINGRLIDTCPIEDLYWDNNGMELDYRKKLKQKVNFACETLLSDFIVFIDQRLKEDEDW